MAFNQTDNFFASNDHIVRTSREWDDSAIANYPIPRGVLCVEITPKNHTRLKVGEGDKYYHQLPYIDGDAELSNYYTKQEVDNIITNLNYMSIASTTVYESRNALPKTGNRLGDLRFVKNPNQGLEDPIEYIWNGKKWVLVGGGWTEVDLSGYAKKSEVNPRLDRLEAQAHTHKNKTVLDNTTASYTLEEKSKLTSLHNYDDAPIQRRVSSLEEKAHVHVNKEILDDTTAAFTREEKTKLAELENYSDFVGTDGTGDGTHGLVPAPQSTDANKYLSSDGTWKSVAAGSIEPATADTLGGVKIGSGVNVTQDGTISVTPYDDTAVRQDITALQASAHTHSNKSVLDNTTASYTIAEQTKLAGLENYTLPVASANTLGGIKVGDGLSIDQDGILSADGSIVYRAGAGISIETSSGGDPSIYDTTHPYYSDTQTSAILDCPGRRRTYTRTTTNPAYVVISRVKNTSGLPYYWYTVYVISKNINDTLCNFLDSDHFSGRSSTADAVSVTIDGTTWYGNGYMISLGDIDPVGDVNEVVPYFESEETSATDTVAAILDYIYSDDTSKYIVNTGVLDVTKNASGNLVVSKESGDTTITLPQEYTLPIASANDLGGVIIGDGITVDENGVISASGGEYIAGDGISIVTGGQIVTDLSSANWGNYADMYDGRRSPTSDSRTFKLRYLHIEPGTQFKIKLTPADPNDTIYWYLYGYENDAATTGGLHFGPSSDPNDWDTDCDYVYTMPAGKSSLDITVRINNTQYGYGDVVTLSKFDEMQYITGTGPTTKTINVTPATTQAIGGVIVGNGLNITQQGVLSLNQLELHCTQNPSS